MSSARWLLEVTRKQILDLESVRQTDVICPRSYSPEIIFLLLAFVRKKSLLLPRFESSFESWFCKSVELHFWAGFYQFLGYRLAQAALA